jgi:hypothetical protein
MPCQKKERLLAASENSAALYSMWVKQMTEARTMAPCDAYEDLRKLAAEALMECELDRRELEGHVNAHGC